jgi:hypothetical protein
MKSVRHLFLGAFCYISCVLPLFSQTALGEPEAVSQRVNPKRDGQHDFDFNIGTWKTHISRLQNPLTGSTTWVEYDGISVVRGILNGHASLFELTADGRAGHLEGVSLPPEGNLRASFSPLTSIFTCVPPMSIASTFISEISLRWLRATMRLWYRGSSGDRPPIATDPATPLMGGWASVRPAL